ncbi:isochorismatase family protein [Methylocella sp. CPCC 101449]|uniref:isochorismatase family protein n=1 Tax=Methylocella sp. CPCC 101449 TaxID=2987531 RepID=UPI00390886FD
MPNLLPVSTTCALVIARGRYSSFLSPSLVSCLQSKGVEGLLNTVAQTDVYIPSMVLDAVDQRYRVIIVRDDVCISLDEGHNARIICTTRYSPQVA